MARARLPALLALALALAGCAQDTPAPSPGDPAPSREGPPALLHLGECHGFRAGTLPAPEAASPARPPPGWGSQAGPSTIDLLALECTRLSLGAIERGPVRLVAETHTDFEAPPACVADGRGARAFLVTLFVDDPGLAAHFREAYGLPAVAAEIGARSAVDPANPFVRGTWTWGPPGQPPSELTFLDDGDRIPEASAPRLLWMEDGAVGLLDLDQDLWRPSTPRVGEGTMREPMLLAAAPGSRFVGGVEPIDGMAAEGVFRLYADADCLEPRA